MKTKNIFTKAITAVTILIGAILIWTSSVKAEQGTISDGVYTIGTKLNTAYILDVAGPSLDNYAGLQIWTDADYDNQRFIVKHIENDEYTITSLYSNKALEASGGNVVYQNQPNLSNPAQRWIITNSTYDGYYFIINKASGLYLDVDNAYADLGVPVQVFVRNDGYDAQDWLFRYIGSLPTEESSDNTLEIDETQNAGNDEQAKTNEEIEETTPNTNITEETEGVSISDISIMEKEETNITAQAPIIWNVIYVLNGTNVTNNNALFRLENESLILKDATRPGYTFGGWYSDKSLKNKITEIKKDTPNNVTVYAKWTLAQYKINYNLNGGKNSSSNPTTYTIENAITLKDGTKSGYTFGGWYSDSSFKTKVVQISKGSIGNKTFYAKWISATAKKYKITYHLNSDSKATAKNNSKNPANYIVGTGTITLQSPTKKGYQFGGWYKERACKNKVTSIDTKSGKDYELYARWISNDSILASIDTLYLKLSNIVKGKSFNGKCGAFVYQQLFSKGIVTGKSHESTAYGKDYTTEISKLKKTSTGYKVTKYEGSWNGLNKIINENKGKAVENIMISYNNGGNFNGKDSNGKPVGHVMLISRIENGKVYFIDNTQPCRNSEGNDYFARCYTLSQFKSFYFKSSNKPVSLVHFTK